MSRCAICGDVYYRQSEIDPAEPCWCGDMAWGRLWDWDRHRAWFKFARYRFAALVLRVPLVWRLGYLMTQPYIR